MQITFKLTSSIEKQTAGCCIVGIYEDGALSPSATIVDELSNGAINKIIKQNPLAAKLGQCLPLFHLTKDINCLILVGLGKEKALSPTQYRNILMNTTKAIVTLGIKEVSCFLTEPTVYQKDQNWQIKQIVEMVINALYRFDLFKSTKEPAASLQNFNIYLAQPKFKKEAELAIKQGKAIASGMYLAKNLANLPSNICTPSFLAEQAEELAKQYPTIKIRTLDEKAMKKLGMGALLAVSQGSAEEAKLICVEYSGKAKSKKPIALIGKGITFDTGGNSLKPADSMVGMKYDMCGAATVLGTLKAAAELELPLSVVGIIPAVENMPGGTAYKPEDILTSLSGQTIEVISTDAEGRLILADALTYCEQQYQPEVVIDIATLTGAVVIALGFHATALLSNDQTLANHLLKAGEESHDRVWQLPLWEEYQEQIKSPFADMANTGGRPAGTITAACFLSRFAKKMKWAHLDVAGTAAMMMGTQERMATGRPIPLLVQYLIAMSK